MFNLKLNLMYVRSFFLDRYVLDHFLKIFINLDKINYFF